MWQVVDILAMAMPLLLFVFIVVIIVIISVVIIIMNVIVAIIDCKENWKFLLAKVKKYVSSGSSSILNTNFNLKATLAVSGTLHQANEHHYMLVFVCLVALTNALMGSCCLSWFVGKCMGENQLNTDSLWKS